MPDLEQIVEKHQPTFYFIGVTTQHSAVMRIFPRWMEVLGRPEVLIEGVDLPIHAEPQAYRRIVAQIKQDPNSLGGLVTSHKISLFRAAHDLFDYFDPYATLLGELSCISKPGGRLEGHAKDPISAGLCLEALLGKGYFGRTGGQVLLLGAGGAGAATLLRLASQPDPADRPKRILAVDILPERLAHLNDLMRKINSDVSLETVLNTEAPQNDALMATLPPYSLVINATGMGKDIPGSPITDKAVFPLNGVAWEFNYRGELIFLRQARRQTHSRRLRVEDGWLYFLHGWTQVMAQVLRINLDAQLFRRLGEAAEEFRGG